MILFTAEKTWKSGPWVVHIINTHRAKRIHCVALLWKPFQEQVIDGKQVNANIINF